MLSIVITSSVLILILLGLRRMLRGRIALRLQYALWLLVALRLLIPVQFGHSILSLQNWMEANTSPVQQASPAPVVTVPPVEYDAPVILPTDESISETAPTTPMPPVTQHVLTPSVQAPTTAVTPEGPEPLDKALSTEEILRIVWLCGSLAMGAWFLTVNLRFSLRAKKNAKALSRPNFSLRVYESEHIPSPCLLGLFPPKVYLLPMEDPEAERHILAHEYTHYRHADGFWALIRALCLCIYWFHPLVWVAAYVSKRDCELACDEGALQRLGEAERIPYGKTLLQTAAGCGRSVNLMQTATTLAVNKEQLKERLEMIVKKPKKLVLALFSMLLVVAIAVGCTFTGAEESTEPTERSSETETTEATEPTSETTTAPTTTQETPSEPITLLYESGNYRLPRLTYAAEDSQAANAELCSVFGQTAEEAAAKYSSVDFSWAINTVKPDEVLDTEIEVLSLVVTGQTAIGEIRLVYNIDVHTGETAAIGFYDAMQQTVSELFVQELLQKYVSTGRILYDEETHRAYEENVWVNQDEAAGWYDAEGKLWCSVPYTPLSGEAAQLRTLCLSEAPAGVTGIERPTVIELYSYADSTGSLNHIPFVLMNGSRAVTVNAELLLLLHDNCSNARYEWAQNGSILSLAVTLSEEHTEGTGAFAYNLSTETGTDVPRAEVLAQAGMTEEAYTEQARELFKNHFFLLFPGLPYENVYRIVEKCGSDTNIGESTPYLDQNGKLWACARIFQVAGSSFSRHLIPISAPTWSPAYSGYAEARKPTLALVPRISISDHEEISRSAPGADLAVLTQQNTLPIYEDPYIVTHGGRQYELTESLLGQRERRAEDYLTLLYGESEYELFYEESEAEEPGILGPFYENDSILLRTGETGVSVHFKDSSVTLPTLPERILLQMPELTAALEYVGIFSPQITQEVHYLLDGSIDYRRYIITEAGNSWAENGMQSSFRCVEVLSHVSGTNLAGGKISVYLSRNSFRQTGSTSVPSVMSFYRFFREELGMELLPEFTVELFYDDTVQAGVYVPCYRVYVELDGLTVGWNRGYAVYELTDSRFLTEPAQATPDTRYSPNITIEPSGSTEEP